MSMSQTGNVTWLPAGLPVARAPLCSRPHTLPHSRLWETNVKPAFTKMDLYHRPSSTPIVESEISLSIICITATILKQKNCSTFFIPAVLKISIFRQRTSFWLWFRPFRLLQGFMHIWWLNRAVLHLHGDCATLRFSHIRRQQLSCKEHNFPCSRKAQKRGTHFFGWFWS